MVALRTLSPKGFRDTRSREQKSEDAMSKGKRQRSPGALDTMIETVPAEAEPDP